jgi:hypothetical protein
VTPKTCPDVLLQYPKNKCSKVKQKENSGAEEVEEKKRFRRKVRI